MRTLLNPRIRAILAIVCLMACAVRAGWAAPVLTNGSFELPTLSAGTYQYLTGLNNGWVYSDAGVLTAQGCTPWYYSSPPTGYSGAQYALLQGGSATNTQAYITQTFTATTAGVYSITWVDAGRPANGSAMGNQTYNVDLNATVLGSYSTTSGQQFTAHTLSNVDLLAGTSYTFGFYGTNLAGGDNTAFLDNVSFNYVTALPEANAASLLLLCGGIAALSTIRRRTRLHEI